MGGVKAGGDRPARHPERGADLFVVEVGVVAQEKDKALSLWETRDRGAHFRPLLTHRRPGRCGGVAYDGPTPLLGQADVDERAPDPRLQCALATKAL